MNFVAIDFETANEKRNSPCALGIAVIIDDRIEEKREWLIRPPELRFAHWNTSIHGITESDVRDKPSLEDIWQDVSIYIDGSMVIAHNASFDFSVLRSTLEHYSLQAPNCSIACSWKVAKNAISGLHNYRLSTVSNHLGIELVHHNALSDAVASAEIMMRCCRDKNFNSIEMLMESIGLRIGRLSPDAYSACGIKGISQKVKRGKTDFKVAESGAFAEMKFVFTGRLDSMTRKDAKDIVASLGGDPSSSITTTTSYLVIGRTAYANYLDGKRSTKLKKAEEYIEKGYSIEIISEDDFLELAKSS